MNMCRSKIQFPSTVGLLWTASHRWQTPRQEQNSERAATASKQMDMFSALASALKPSGNVSPGFGLRYNMKMRDVVRVIHSELISA
jgi:hypothetical protein